MEENHGEAACGIYDSFNGSFNSGRIGVQADNHDTVPITDVKFVPISSLMDYGFSERFMRECECGLTNVPPYVGKDTFFDLENIF